MTKWSVERINGRESVVEADEIELVGPSLLLHAKGAVIAAFAAGHWLSVSPIEPDKFADATHAVS